MTLTTPREHAPTVATQGQAKFGGDSLFAVAPGERVPERPRGGINPLSRPPPACAGAARGPTRRRRARLAQSSFWVRGANSSVVKARRSRRNNARWTGPRMLAGRVYVMATRAHHAPNRRRRHQGLCGIAGTMNTMSALSRSFSDFFARIRRATW